jgi:hypothetical protein
VRKDTLEHIDFLAKQAALPKQERHPSVGRAVAEALAKTLSVYADLSTEWGQVEPHLRPLF